MSVEFLFWIFVAGIRMLNSAEILTNMGLVTAELNRGVTMRRFYT